MLKKPIFFKSNADWLSELPSIVKKYNSTIQNSIEKTPIQASKKLNEKEVYSNLKYNREFGKPEVNPGHLVRTIDIQKVLIKREGTNHSYKLYTITEVLHNTLTSYRLNYLTDRYNRNLLLPTKLSLDANQSSYERIELNSIKINLINGINRR